LYVPGKCGIAGVIRWSFSVSPAAIAGLTAMIKMDTIREEVLLAAGSENP
jgi:hypothetical protein